MRKKRRRERLFDANSHLSHLLITNDKKHQKWHGNKKAFPVQAVKRGAAMVAAFAAIALLSPKVFANPFKSVKVTDGYGEYTLLTQSETVGELVQKGTLNLKTGDTTAVAAHESLTDGMDVGVDRAVTVTVISGGNATTLRMKKGTVRDALNDAGIAYKEEDVFSPSLDTVLANGDTVVHSVIDTKTVTQRVSLPFDTVEVKDSALAMGKREVVFEGENGYKNVEYTVTYQDGVEISRQVSGEKVVRAAKDRQVAVGTKTEKPDTSASAGNTANTGGGSSTAKPKPPVTDKPNIITPDELPAGSVAKTMTMQVTAYTHTSKPTASGNMPGRGTVAVDKSVIPLGTKLYIPGYGYGVAQDTGGFGSNVIDVFMNTEAECLQWGRKTLTIYILK